MSRRDPQEKALTFRPLYQSAVVSVYDYQCRAHRSGPGEEEHSDTSEIVLMRHGVFCRHFGRRSVTADLNQVAFFSKGSASRVSHPADCGDRGSVFRVTEHVLSDMIRDFDPAIDDHPELPFPRATALSSSRIHWRHLHIIGRLQRVALSPPEPLWADEVILELIGDVLDAAFDAKKPPYQNRRKGTDADYAQRCEAAKAYLAGRVGESVTLDQLARSVNMSPFHFARIFRQLSGMPPHRYLLQLRLQAALERLHEGEKDLTALALDLGFSSHGHFSDTFRREFHRTPSQVRRTASNKTLHKMRKNLEARFQ